MITRALKFTGLILFLSFSSSAQASRDAAYLDPPYRNHRHPAPSRLIPGFTRTPRSAIETVISHQSPVKSQGSRGTCSIFSSTALIESLLIQNGQARSIDLSEEWLEYIAVRNHFGDGSNSASNIQAINRYGMAQEQTLPYIPETWESPNESALAKQRCGKLPASARRSCLIVHHDPRLLDASDEAVSNPQDPLYDPDFLRARDEAKLFRSTYFPQGLQLQYLSETGHIKQALLQGHPLLLDIDFYYGAWNHRTATTLGIQRNNSHWEYGIVGYPEPGSVDIQASLRDRAGHSVLIVGFDDTVEVKTQIQMQDGSQKEFTYKGVYYFKNSWGTSSFGSRTVIGGKPHPGYGVITQKYAHEYGTFFIVPGGR